MITWIDEAAGSIYTQQFTEVGAKVDQELKVNKYPFGVSHQDIDSTKINLDTIAVVWSERFHSSSDFNIKAQFINTRGNTFVDDIETNENKNG